MIFSVLKWGALVVGAARGVQIAWLGPRNLTGRETLQHIDRYLTEMAIEYARTWDRPVNPAIFPLETFPAPRDADCSYGCCKAGDEGLFSEAVR